MDVLTTFIRQAARKDANPRSGKPTEDIQSAINVLARRGFPRTRIYEREYDSPIDVHETDLSEAWLGSGGHFEWGFFDDSYLRRADLGYSSFDRAGLKKADLSEANLVCATFVDADLGGANLTGANLGGATLNGANLGGAKLIDATLSGSHLVGTKFNGADLSGTNFDGADVSDR